MPSIDRIKASDGTGPASIATVQNTRAALSSTIVVDTVDNINTTFYGTMGTPHTFVDPITSETITVISEATAVDFSGHVDGSNLEIDAIDAGFTDNGSDVGDIIIIKPTTEHMNNVAEVLEVAHNDNGTIKNDAITTENQFTDNINPILRASNMFYDFVASGGVWTGDAYGSTRAASMTALVAYINGQRGTVSAVTARTFTASKDTYIDVLNTAGVFSLVYTEVTNNAASPALAANSIRLGIIVTGASHIANVGSVNQGQEDKILPIASSIAYAVTDSLGNLICPRDPNRKLLGYRFITGNQGGFGTTPAQVTGLSAPVKVPTGRKVKVVVEHPRLVPSAAFGEMRAQIWEGTVGSGTQLQQVNIQSIGAGTVSSEAHLEALRTPSTSSITYNASLSNDGNGGSTTNVQPPAGSAAFIRVELE